MAAFFLNADPVLANQHCRLDGEIITDYLKDKYGEGPVIRGVADSGQVMFELWANPATGTWSFISQSPGGAVCIHASGGEFEQLPLAQGTAI